MDKKDENVVSASFIVTIIERDILDLAKLVDSYKNMLEYEKTELIILVKYLSADNEKNLNRIVGDIPQISYYICYGANRCQRKDIGLEYAVSNHLIYIDADCTIDKDYFVNIKEDMRKYRVIRGKNAYIHSKKYLSKCNSIYRTLCDDMVFRDETFTPNLVIEKNFLKNAGGWEKDNTDAGDDFTLSRRLKRIYKFEIKHNEDAVMRISNSADENFGKLIKTWLGYGKGYQIRRRNNGICNVKTFFEYIPPFVYRFTKPVYYFPIAILNWIILFCGYSGQIRSERKNVNEI